MNIAVIKERRAGETRVAATPDTVRKLKSLGLNVVVESGAGEGARIADSDYTAAGAQVANDRTSALQDAQIVLKVRAPDLAEVQAMPSGAILIGLLSPYTERETIVALALRQIDAFAMEFLPRISRAQSMDVLSSQANLAGYKAVIVAAAHFG